MTAAEAIVARLRAASLLATLSCALAPAAARAETPLAPAEQVQIAPNVTEVRKSRPGSTEVPSPSAAEPRPVDGQPPRLSAITFSDPAPNQSRITLELDRTTRISAFSLVAPERIVIDVEAASAASLAASEPTAAGLIADYRKGLIGGGTFRIILDLRRPARVLRITPAADGAVRLSIALMAVEAETAKRAAELPAVVYDPQAPFTPPPDLRRPNGRPVVMLDPGHGGVDPGATADGGVQEKDVVLAVALEARKALVALGRYEVRMTRSGDQFVRLDDRVAAAENAGAELFVSIHADSFAGQVGATNVRGGSIYVLGDDAANRMSAAFAAKENAADARAGLAVPEPAADAQVGNILADLAARETLDLSSRAQGLLIRDLRRAMTLAREPARAASFRVLRQAQVPSVLIELGYMSNAADIGLLQSVDWQRQVAAAIARAIDGYFATIETGPLRGRIATP